MNTKVIAGIVAVVIIGLGVYFATANKSPENNDDQTQEQTGDQSNNSGDNGQPSSTTQQTSLKGLLGMGTQKCTYGDGQSQGTVYVANGKSRMDMSSMSNGVTTSTHAIIDGETYYGWVDGQAQGFMFSIDQSATGSAGPTQNVDLNEQVSYNCGRWSADASLFTAPAGVQFVDLNAMGMPGGMN